VRTFVPIAWFTALAGVAQIATAQASAGEKALFGEMPVVQAAALHAQTLEEAPANVTIISAADIRKYGYRTLAEALASVRGFDVSYDRIYHYVGVHGFSLPGDYNTRFLVMINGHSMTDSIYGSNNYFGQDFGLDLDLVERIEIIRGPSSALYGTNGIFATINIVTKSPVDSPALRVTTESGSFGEKKAAVSLGHYLGHGANLLIAGSVFNNSGQAVGALEPDRPAGRGGSLATTDGERGYHFFANLVWRNWTITAYFNSREKQPVAPYDGTAIFGASANRSQDRRNFVTASRTASAGAGELRYELSYDQYRYDDRFYYPIADSVEDVRNISRGDWLTAKVVYAVPLKAVGGFTVGAEMTWELRNLQANYVVQPVSQELLRVSDPDRRFALFAQQEWKISPEWAATLGVRFDDAQNFNHFVSPKAALVYRRSAKTVFKFVYGHPFRNPTAYEQYYADGIGYLANPKLRQETAQTFEFSMERKLPPGWSAIVSTYHYRIDRLIQAVFLPDGTQQFQNVAGVRSDGIEGELSGRIRRAETSSSISLQDTSGPGGHLTNSPRVLLKARAALPLFSDRLLLSSSLQYTSSRLTYAEQLLQPFAVNDVTLTWRRKNTPWELQFGVRNLFDCRYSDAVALSVDSLRSDGRSAFLKLLWRMGG
jgi:iron complex outermembrane receptor protein